MISLRFVPLVWKHVVRHRLRSGLTLAGIATAIFLFCTVHAFDRGVTAATHVTGRETTLVVYRENRYCPFTSRLPQFYEQRIAAVPGVRSVVPMKIVVNNCRASLDVVTFRGIPDDGLTEISRQVAFVSGSPDQWRSRSDAAILGEAFARRRGLTVGQSFDAAGITVYVAGIIRSPEAQDQNVAYVHLDFLQRASSRGGVGIVTQFNVKVADSARLEEIAKQIDEQFRSDPEPTQTRPEKAFVARAAADIVQMARFTRQLGWGCLAAVLALVANAIVLSVRDRVKQYAIFQTLGFRAGLIASLIVLEAATLSVLGGIAGAAAAYAFLKIGGFSVSIEGVSLTIHAEAQTALIGLLFGAGAGVLAGILPALEASRREIAGCFRAV